VKLVLNYIFRLSNQRNSVVTGLILVVLLLSAFSARAQLTVVAQDQKDACDGLSNGSLNFLVTNSTGAIDINVFGPNSFATTLNPTDGIPEPLGGLEPGLYFTVTQDDFESFNLNFTIVNIVPDLLAVVGSQGDNTDCLTQNGFINLDVTGGSGNFTYAWTGPNSFTAATQDVASLEGGNYFVDVFDDDTNCSRSLGPIALANPFIANQNITTASPVVVCPADDITISLDGSELTRTYEILVNGAGSGFTTGGTGAAINITILSGNFIDADILTVEGTSGICTSVLMTGMVTVSIRTLSVAPISANVNPSLYCDNAIPASITLSYVGGSLGTGATAEWYDDAGFSSSVGSGNGLVIGAPAVSTTFFVRFESPCGNTSGQSALVTVSPAPNAGVATAQNTCSNISSFDLFSGLAGHDGGGSWNDDDGTGALAGSIFNATAVASGASYNFTYTVLVVGCADDTETLTVTVNTAPNAGVATPQNTCTDINNFDLFTGLAGNDLGGAWTDDDATGALTGSLFDATTVIAGSYNFTYTVTVPGCVDDTETLTVTVLTAPNAGVATAQNTCSNINNFDLFSGLAGNDPGGTWNDDDGSGELIVNIFDAMAAGAGVYNFTYTVSVAGCADDTETLTVTVNMAPNAGVATPQSTCTDISNFDLFTGLAGNDLGGAWTDDDATGALTGSLFDATAVGAGSYDFTYTVTVPGCADDTETLTVTVLTAPNAGVATAQNTCGNINNFDLFSGLAGNDPGGTWNDDDGSGELIVNIFDAMAAGTGVYNFTYTVSVAGCADDTETLTVTVTVNMAPNAGVATPQSTCTDISNFDLFTGLAGNDPGGAWTDDDATGALTGSLFDATAVGAGSYDFTYTVTVAGCVDDTEILTVTVVALPDATISGAIAVCTNTSETYSVAAGEASYTWTLSGGDGTISSGAGTNSITVDWLLTGGDLQVDITGLAPTNCLSTSTETITIFTSLPTLLDPTMDVCQNSATFPILVATPIVGATVNWYDGPSATGTLLFTGDSFTLTATELDLTVAGTTTFIYTQDIGCLVSADASFDVNVIAQPVAGGDNSLAACGSGSTIDLFTQLTGTPDAGGTWTDDDSSGALTGSIFNPAVSGDGIFNFTYQVNGAGACLGEVATAVVTVSVGTANAGTATNQPTCNNVNNFDLFTGLSGHDSGGTWADDDATGALTASTFDATLVLAGSYDFTYTVSVAGCTDDTETLTVTVGTLPNAGLTSPQSTCSTVTNFDLFVGLSGNDLGGTWNDDDASGALSGNIFDASAVADGTYNFTYTVSVAGCADDTETVTVSVNSMSISPIPDQVLYLACTYGPAPTLNTPGVGIVWYADVALTNMVFTGNMFTPVDGTDIDMMVVGFTSFFVTQNEGCGESAAVQVDVELEGVSADIGLVLDTYPEQDIGTIEVINISSDNPPYEVSLEDDAMNIIVDFVAVEADRLGAFSHTFNQLSAGNYVVIVRDASGCELPINQTINNSSDVFIPNIFTPNNDGYNEFFGVLNKLPNTEILITNRWGVKVYESKDYQNDWQAENLPDGVYFYTIKMGGALYNGNIEVWRSSSSNN